MRIVFGLVLILGMGLAAFAVNMARGYFSTYEAEAQRLQSLADGVVETAQVFVVTRKIRHSERLTREHVKLVNWPTASLPEGVFTFPATELEGGKPGEDLFPKGTTKFRAVLRTMEVNEPILVVKVTAPGKEAGIESVLAKGMRATTIKVTANSGVAGFLRPGHHVDVSWSGNVSGRRITRLILPGVKVIAIDQSTDEDRPVAKIARTVTVEATPMQTAALAQAQATGRVSLSLVGFNEVSKLDSFEIDQTDLLGIEAAEIIVREDAEKCYHIERKGVDRVKIEVECAK